MPGLNRELNGTLFCHRVWGCLWGEGLEGGGVGVLAPPLGSEGVTDSVCLCFLSRLSIHSHTSYSVLTKNTAKSRHVLVGICGALLYI